MSRVKFSPPPLPPPSQGLATRRVCIPPLSLPPIATLFFFLLPFSHDKKKKSLLFLWLLSKYSIYFDVGVQKVSRTRGIPLPVGVSTSGVLGPRSTCYSKKSTIFLRIDGISFEEKVYFKKEGARWIVKMAPKTQNVRAKRQVVQWEKGASRVARFFRNSVKPTHLCVGYPELEEFVGKDGRLFREARVSLLHPLTDARGFMVVHWSTKRLENGMCARLVATPLFPPPRLLYPFNFDGAMLPIFPLIATKLDKNQCWGDRV